MLIIKFFGIVQGYHPKLKKANILISIYILISILLNKNPAISTEENETSENSQSLTKAAS